MELSSILQTASTLAIGIIAYFVKSAMTDIKTDIEKNNDRINFVEKKLDDLKSDLPFVYTTREDFIRSLNNVDSKMTNMDNKLDKLLQIKG